MFLFYTVQEYGRKYKQSITVVRLDYDIMMVYLLAERLYQHNVLEIGLYVI